MDPAQAGDEAEEGDAMEVFSPYLLYCSNFCKSLGTVLMFKCWVTVEIVFGLYIFFNIVRVCFLFVLFYFGFLGGCFRFFGQGKSL